MGLGRPVNLDKACFVGQRALAAEQARGPSRQIVGLELDWPSVEALYEAEGLPPTVAAQASRVAVPVHADGAQIGKATSTTWSPTLKKLIALALVTAPHTRPGTRLEMEVTVEAGRHRVPAVVTRTPFFNPPQDPHPAGVTGSAGRGPGVSGRSHFLASRVASKAGSWARSLCRPTARLPTITRSRGKTRTGTPSILRSRVRG
jgi:hypothetical protein